MTRRPSPGNVTSPYGWRIHPITGTRRFHTGEDINASDGTTLVMPGDGTVSAYRLAGGYGRQLTITLDDPRTVITLSHTEALLVGTGAKLQEGQPVAVMGTTGDSTGIHVHWEVIKDGKRINPVDWLTQTAGAPPVATPNPKGVPMFAIVNGVDSKLQFVTGITGKRCGIQSAHHLEVMKRFQSGLLAGRIESFYWGDQLTIEYYLGQVNGR